MAAQPLDLSHIVESAKFARELMANVRMYATAQNKRPAASLPVASIFVIHSSEASLENSSLYALSREVGARGPRSGFGSVEGFLQPVLRLDADESLDDLSALEDHDRRNAAHTIVLRCLRRFIYV